MYNSRLGSTILFLGFLILNSCGSGGDTNSFGSLSLGLTWKHAADGVKNKTLHSAAPNVCVDYDITQIYAYVRNASNTIVAQGNWPCQDHTATLTGIPAGTVSIEVTGITTTPDWRGQKTGVIITGGGNTDLSGSPIVMTYVGSDNILPIVISRDPAVSAMDVPLSTHITASFSEAMAISSINENTFTVKALASSVCGTVSYDAGKRMATCEPSTALSAGTIYTATVTTGATDMAGNGLASSATWTFTTFFLPNTPTGLVASPGDNRAIISWNTVTGTTSFNLYVSTSSPVTMATGSLITVSGAGTPLQNCSHPVKSGNYTHFGLTNGLTYYYIITAVNDGGASAPSDEASVFVGPTTASALALCAQPDVMAGQIRSLSVTALDSNGYAATTYSGTVHFTSSDPQSVLPSNYAFLAGDAGTHSFSATLKTAGTQTVTISDAGNSALTSSVSVTVTSTLTPAKLGFSVQPSTTTVNTAISPAIVVEIQDEYGNRIMTATEFVTLSFDINPSGASLSGSVNQFAAAGQASFSDLSINSAGIGYTLRAQSGVLLPAFTSPFTIN